MKIRSILYLLVLGLVLGGCATGGDRAGLPDSQPQEAKVKPSRAELEARVVQELQILGEADIFREGLPVGPDGEASHDIPITINNQVEQFIDYFQNKIPKRFGLYLSRSTRYNSMMRAILKDYGLPEDLIYVALIESGFSCTATSKAAAVGPWQFIKASGIRFGLKVDAWVDERQDPIKATHAAARYLRELYAEFGSWYLATAAYNAGENKIRRALSRYQASDYWTISHRQRPYLANETKEYVPKLIAAAIIAKDPQRYGFTDIPYEPPMAYDEVTVHPGISLNALARMTDLSAGELAALNPELKRGVTPPFNGMYSLRVPLGAGSQFQTMYARLPQDQLKARLAPASIVAHRGDTPQSIAKDNGVKLADLLALNPKMSPTKLRPGQKVIVPGGGPADDRPLAAKAAPAPAPGKAPAPVVAAKAPPVVVHTPPASVAGKGTQAVYTAPHREQRRIVHAVAKGDTIWDLAQTYNVEPSEISRANGKKKKLTVGQQLVLYAPHAKVEAKLEPRVKPQAVAAAERREIQYRVQKGDNLWNISKRFNVSPDDLKRWNKLNGNALSPGNVLVVRKGS